MEEIKEGLSQRIEKYKRELDTLKNDREEIDNKIQSINKLLESCKILYADEIGEKLNDSKPSNQRFRNMTINAAAIEILKDIKEGHAKTITKRLLKGGKIINSEKPFIVVANSLRQDDRFKKIGRNIFRLNLEKIEKSAPLFQ